MIIRATTNNSRVGNSASLSHASLAATGTRMVGPDILRSLAILLVILVHLPLDATPGVLVAVREYGWLGVDIFFVLSGYLIGTQLFKEVTRTENIEFKLFYFRRAIRIFPAYFVVLALYALVPSLRDNPTMQPLWKFATFTVNLGFDPREGNAFSQAWTLAVEEQFYLVLPLLALLLYKRIGPKWVLTLAGLVILGGIVLRYAIWDIHVGTLVEEGKFRPAFATYLRDVYYPTYTRLDGLLFGVMLAAARFFKPEFCRQYLSPKVTLSLGLSFVITAFICFFDRGPLAGQGIFPVFQAQLGAVVGFPLISIGVAMVFCAMLDLEHVLSRWPVPGAAIVATLSYSLYLTHKSVFRVMQLVAGKENLQGSFGFVVYLIASFAAALVLWFCVERTFLKLRDKIL